MRREPSSSLLKTNSSSRESRYSRRREFPVENIPGEAVAVRKRKGLAGRRCRRNCRSCSYRRRSRNRSRSCHRRYSCRNRDTCQNRGSRWSRDWNNRGNLCCDRENLCCENCANRGWNSWLNRYSNRSALADNLDWGPVDRRSQVERRRGPGWPRWQDPEFEFDPQARRPVASGPRCPQVCCIP
jgi:hypothetical protein